MKFADREYIILKEEMKKIIDRYRKNICLTTEEPSTIGIINRAKAFDRLPVDDEQKDNK